MYWREELSFRITPKSGPVRSMDTLLDANRAVTRDLPAGYLKKNHWSQAGWAVFNAGSTGHPSDIKTATEALVRAVECEGWMDRNVVALQMTRLDACLKNMGEHLRQCIGTADGGARKPRLKLIIGTERTARSSIQTNASGDARASGQTVEPARQVRARRTN